MVIGVFVILEVRGIIFVIMLLSVDFIILLILLKQNLNDVVD
jgi:hypothetical protein